MNLDWQPWATAPIHDGEIVLLVAINKGAPQGVVYQTFRRCKISNGFMNIIGGNFDFDEERPFAWARFNQIDFAPESDK